MRCSPADTSGAGTGFASTISASRTHPGQSHRKGRRARLSRVDQWGGGGAVHGALLPLGRVVSPAPGSFPSSCRHLGAACSVEAEQASAALGSEGGHWVLLPAGSRQACLGGATGHCVCVAEFSVNGQ